MSTLTVEFTWPNGAPAEGESLVDGAEVLVDYTGMTSMEAAELLVEAAREGAKAALAETSGGHRDDPEVDVYSRLWLIAHIVNTDTLSEDAT